MVSTVVETNSPTCASQLFAPCERRQNIPSATSILIVTRDRLETLETCLATYIGNAKTNGRTPDFIVFDDSPAAGTRENTRQLLRTIQTIYGVRLFYAGLEEKLQFANDLVAITDTPKRVIDFALFDPEHGGTSIGANRNCALLHSVGQLVLACDDDTQCFVRQAPSCCEKPVLYDDPLDPTEFWFYTDYESALCEADLTSPDILSLHESVLGMTVDIRPRAPAAQAIPQPWRTQSTEHYRCVIASPMGVLGDSGMARTDYYLMLVGPSRERLLASEAHYVSARKSGQVLRLVVRPTVARPGFCMALAIGLDNRCLLPPFFPIYRNEDGVWSKTLADCFPDRVMCYLPWAVVHRRRRDQSVSAKCDVETICRLRMCDIVCAAMASFAGEYTSNSADNLQRLGKHFIDLGSCALREFERYITVQVWIQRKEYVRRLQTLLSCYDGQPQFWAADVESEIVGTNQSCVDGGYIIPRELFCNTAVEEQRQKMQRLILRFGDLLYYWPNLIDGGQTLRRRGRTLALRV